jgi:hypothetical protein
LCCKTQSIHWQKQTLEGAHSQNYIRIFFELEMTMSYLTQSMSLTPFQNFILFSSAHCFSFRAHSFFYLGTIRRFSQNGTDVTHWWFHNYSPINTSVDVLKYQILSLDIKCWILLPPVLWGIDGNLLLPLPTMNRLNQTDPATFSILSFFAFFRDSLL